MLSKFIDALKTFFSAKPMSLQFEEMLLQEAVQKIKDEDAAREKVAAVEAKATVAKVKVVAKTAAPKAKAAAKKPAAKKTSAKKKPTMKIVK